MAPLRWGIASSGKISHDFVVCLRSLNPEHHQVVAVAARSKSSAEQFAAHHKIKNAYGSYEELAADPEVDVVYVGTIHPYHLPVSKAMLEAGKHVLCEKPLGMNVREIREMMRLAKEKRLFLMEGMWSRCFPAYQRLREEIASGSIGDVIHVTVTFGVPIAGVDRVYKKDLGGGVMLDIGIYTVQMVCLAFNSESPSKIVATGQLNQSGVDESVSSSFLYSNGRLANCFITSKAKLNNEAHIIGTKGTIIVREPFWAPTRIDTPSGPIDFPLPKVDEPVNYGNSEGLCYEAEEVYRCIKAGLFESPLIPQAESELIATMMGDVRMQVGVEYPQDVLV